MQAAAATFGGLQQFSIMTERCKEHCSHRSVNQPDLAFYRPQLVPNLIRDLTRGRLLP